MITERQKKHIETSRKYGIRPGSLKCEAYSLFDAGYSLREARYLLRHYRNPRFPKRFASTLRKYYILWKEAQAQI